MSHEHESANTEKRIAAGEAELKKWKERFSRGARIKDTPFRVTVSLLREDSAWEEITVSYTSRFAAGTSARGRIPLVALVRAGELARELADAKGAGGSRGLTRFVPPPRDEPCR